MGRNANGGKMSESIIGANAKRGAKAQELLAQGKRVWVIFGDEAQPIEIKQVFSRAANIFSFFNLEGMYYKAYIADPKLRFTFEDEIVKVATLDFTEVGLCGHDPITDDCLIESIPWPSDWPETVTKEFLEQQGFRVEVC